MFNHKLKKQIIQLKEQYSIVYNLLQQKQDNVMALKRQVVELQDNLMSVQRTLSALRQQPQSKLPTHFYTDLKNKIESAINHYTDDSLKERITESIANQVADYLSEIIDPILSPDSDEDEYDEDEDD